MPFEACKFVVAGCVLLCVGTVRAAPPLPSGANVDAPPLITTLERYCMDCHTGDDAPGDIDFDGLELDDPVRDSEAWEKVILKLRHRQMPPQDESRPDEATYEALADHLETTIDRAAALSPRFSACSALASWASACSTSLTPAVSLAAPSRRLSMPTVANAKTGIRIASKIKRRARRPRVGGGGWKGGIR